MGDESGPGSASKRLCFSALQPYFAANDASIKRGVGRAQRALRAIEQQHDIASIGVDFDDCDGETMRKIGRNATAGAGLAIAIVKRRVCFGRHVTQNSIIVAISNRLGSVPLSAGNPCETGHRLHRAGGYGLPEECGPSGGCHPEAARRNFSRIATEPPPTSAPPLATVPPTLWYIADKDTYGFPASRQQERRTQSPLHQGVADAERCEHPDGAVDRERAVGERRGRRSAADLTCRHAVDPRSA